MVGEKLLFLLVWEVGDVKVHVEAVVRWSLGAVFVATCLFPCLN